MASEDFRNVQSKWALRAIGTDKYCDAIFLVGKEKKRMFGFRGLLANISPVFEATFYGSFRESLSHKEEIEYPTISPSVFECIIRASMNLDPAINAENVMELIQAAHFLQIPELQKECAAFLENNLNVNNVLFVLNAGYCLNSLNKKFYKKSQRIVLKNASQMIVNKGFYSLHPDLLIQFLKSNCFKVKEENLWNSCLKWAENCCDNDIDFKFKINQKTNCKINQKQFNISKDFVCDTCNDNDNDIKDNDSDDDNDNGSDGDDDGDDDGLDTDNDNDNDDNDTDAYESDLNSIKMTSSIANSDNDDNNKVASRSLRIRLALRAIIPYLRYALMDKQFFIDNVASYLTPPQRDSVYIHYILQNRATIFNDNIRIEYSNKKFEIIASNVRIDKAKMLNLVDDWWSHTNFAQKSPQWFVVKLPDPSFICTINWKNRWGDGETAKDIELQVSKLSHDFIEDNGNWITFWRFKSEKTSNWLTFQVPHKENVKPSIYWRIVVKSLYGDNSCRCGLDQIKITCTL